MLGQFHISSGNANIANIAKMANIKMSSSTESTKQHSENQCVEKLRFSITHKFGHNWIRCS